MLKKWKRGRWHRPGDGLRQCICPECGIVMENQGARPCYTLNCPECGSAMARRLRPGCGRP